MYDTVLEAIGSPLVRVRSPAGATVAAKVESFNPGGSAKDRPAREMIEAAERAGDLQPGGGVVEATSGNTGIGLALVGAAKGYDVTLVMPARMSRERRRLLRAYGANLELIDGDIAAARERADEIAAETGGVRLEQFENEANPRAHYRTTAEEIIKQVGDREVDAFVATVGTGGTITGTARRLREAFPDVDVVAVEPADKAVVGAELGEPDDGGPAGHDGAADDGEGGHDEAADGSEGDREGTDREFQGMGPGFVSPLLDLDLLDGAETVDLSAAEREARRLAREEGILVGQSAGAASVAARRVAERLADPARDCSPGDGAGDDPGGGGEGPPADHGDCPLVVTLFPDSGERYLSAGLFGD
ncbi:MAG: PLP-dependent cysteine synthase family protein [Halobacteriales archaeon]